MKYLIKTHVKVGEVAIDICILNAIARLDPESHIEVLATSPTHNLLVETPFIDKLHVRSQSFFSNLSLQKGLLDNDWDVVLVTRKASRLQLFYRFAKAKHKRSRRYMDSPTGSSEIEIRLSMLDGILPGWDEQVDPTIHFDPKRTDQVLEGLGLHRSGRILAIAPGASIKKKMWDKKKFVALAKSIGTRFDHILVLGSKGEHELCEYVALNTGAMNLAGTMELLDVCALLSAISLHVGNDSGLGHLAAGVGSNCVVIGDESGPSFIPWKQHMIVGDPKMISIEQVIGFLTENKIAKMD